MKVSKRLLSALLAVQVGLASLLMWEFNAPLTNKAAAPLLAGDADSVTRLQLSDGKELLALVRDGGRWWLDQTPRLPADEHKVKQVLGELSGLTQNWPVVTQASSHQRFDVANDQFYRKVTWYQGDKPLDTLLVGDTPAMHQSYVRRDDSDDVYALDLNRYDLGMLASAWLDKSLLQLPQVSSLQVGELNAKNTADGWQLTAKEAPNGNASAAPAAVSDAAKLLGNLQVIGLATDEDVSQQTPVEVIEASDGGKSWQYRIYQQDGKTLISRSDIDAVFRIANTDYQTLAALEKADTQLADHHQQTPALTTATENSDG